jgi:predicted AlkP superfamily pyrophosphatase or phosphodiesterase
MNDVDSMGHYYGPDSIQLQDAIARVDNAIAQLISLVNHFSLPFASQINHSLAHSIQYIFIHRGLTVRGLISRSNIIVTSDHGRVDRLCHR